MGINKKVVKAFNEAGGKGKPKYGQVKVCYAKTKEETAETVWKFWPTGGVKGPLNVELWLPRYFQKAVQMLDTEDAVSEVVLGNNTEEYREKLRSFQESGFEYVYLHQIGQNQEAFLRFMNKDIFPYLGNF